MSGLYIAILRCIIYTNTNRNKIELFYKCLGGNSSNGTKT